jgi:hypothetical protein
MSELSQYERLRRKFLNVDFQKKYGDLAKWLNGFSIFGNFASIFFAFFLVNPSLQQAIDDVLPASFLAALLGFTLTIIVLGMFEMIKRFVVKIFSATYVKTKSIGRGFFSLIGSLLLLGASIYFSLNGAINFASTSENQIEVIENNIDSQIDSLNVLYSQRKEPIISEINSLRDDNIQKRKEQSELPSNYVRMKGDLQKIIDKNEEVIGKRQLTLEKMDSELGGIITKLEKEQKEQETESKSKDEDRIVIFLIISLSIEFIIVIGVYFKELFDYNVFKEKEPKLELLFQRRQKYEALLELVYQRGEIVKEDQVMSVSKTTQLAKTRGGMTYTPKIIKDFFADMTNIGVFKTIGNKRIAMVHYDEAIDKLHNIV